MTTFVCGTCRTPQFYIEATDLGFDIKCWRGHPWVPAPGVVVAFKDGLTESTP